MSIERFNQLRSEPETLHLSEMELGEQGETWRFDYRRDITHEEQRKLDEWISAEKTAQGDVITPFFDAYFLRGGSNFKLTPGERKTCAEYASSRELEDWASYTCALLMISRQVEQKRFISFTQEQMKSVVDSVIRHWDRHEENKRQHNASFSLPSLITSLVRAKIIFRDEEPLREDLTRPNQDEAQAFLNSEVEYVWRQLPYKREFDRGVPWAKEMADGAIQLAAHCRLLGKERIELELPPAFWSVARDTLAISREHWQYDERTNDKDKDISRSNFFSVAADLAILTAQEAYIDHAGELIYIPNTVGPEEPEESLTLPNRIKFDS